MMNVIITGKNSYIGQHIKEWLEKSDEFCVKCVSVHEKELERINFIGVDAIIHVAAIVHRKDIEDWMIYKKVNVDLTEKIAIKAKKSGVKQFVFMSSMGVYGIDKTLPTNNIINENTPLQAKSLYGKSKLEAEKKLHKLQNENFTISIVRPPNVYGKDCKGGYIKGFTNIVRVLPVIPCAFLKATQSMLYIDNLSELCKLILTNRAKGIFVPQDETSVSSVELMKGIVSGSGKKRYCSRLLGKIVELFPRNTLVIKGYGGVAYSDELSRCFNNRYVVVPFEEAIRRTVS